MPNRRKLAISLAVIFILNIIIISLFQEIQKADAAVYRRGSTGSVVRQIQQRLKNWGYYFDTVDGIYGPATEQAVRYFQQRNGLYVDGIAGDQTLSAMGIQSSSGATAQSNDVQLLARLISAEARGEPYIGQVAVGAVVLNRVRHPSFPNSISGVIYQPGAFPASTTGSLTSPSPTAPTARRRIASTGGTRQAAPSTTSTLHRHKRVDLVAPADYRHRKAPLLRMRKIEEIISNRGQKCPRFSFLRYNLTILNCKCSSPRRRRA